jgi:hypothetical protein
MGEIYIIVVVNIKLSLIFMKNSFIFNLVEMILLFNFRDGLLSVKSNFCSKTYLGGGVLRHKYNINSN